jgi:SAM-dependent methyltransferase
MNLEDVHYLLSPLGEQKLRELAEIPITPHNHLAIASALRRSSEPSHAQALLETALLRQLATVKFSRAAEMYFTRPALEQASSEIISEYRSRRFRAAGFDHIVDLGCGIGGDSIALAAEADVTGVEWDPVRLVMAQKNVQVYKHGPRFHPLLADLGELTPFPTQAAYLDPSRRDKHGRRFFSMSQYQPSMSVAERWLERVEHVAMKISPGVDYRELPDEAEVEFVSVGGELKEGVLWFGEFNSGVSRRATLLPGRVTITSKQMGADTVPAGPPGRYLYEPDKAVIRAHLVTALAVPLEGTLLDPTIAYLTADSLTETPFARCFEIEAHFPFQLKRLRHYLRERRIGHVTIKKRGSPLEPEQLKHQLRLQGEEHRIVFLTQVMGEATVLIGREISVEA